MKQPSRTLLTFTLSLLFVGLTTTAHAEQRPKIGLVLGGGGALGLAHIGVIRVLEQNHIPIDVITGTSMGAIVGGLYATGKTSDQIETILKDVQWDALFSDQPKRQELSFRRKTDDRGFLGTTKLSFKDGNVVLPAGAIYGQNIDLLFGELFKEGAALPSFDALPIPFRAIGADIETGEPVVIGKGDLGRAARASMSVPGVFAPVEIDGRVLVDGGIANNLPMDQARLMGADILIVVNLPNDFQKRDKLQSAFAIAGQVLSFLLDQNAKRQLEKLTPRDILIEPVLTGYTPTDFDKAEPLVQIGLTAGQQADSRLKDIQISPDAYEAWRRQHRQPLQSTPVIDFIRINNKTSQKDTVILNALGIKVGDPLDRQKIEQHIQTEYNKLLYAQLRYEVVSEGDTHGVVFSAEERPWLNEYLRLGFQLADNFEGESSYTFGANYRWTKINQAGGEFEVEGRMGLVQRLGLELFQPFEHESPYFLSAVAFDQRETLQIYQDDSAIAKYRRDNEEVGLALGKIFSNTSEFRLGVLGGTGAYKRTIGDNALPEIDFNTVGYFSKFAIDTFDNASFPHDGNRVDIKYTSLLDGWGSTDSFETVTATMQHAVTFGQTSIIPSFALARGLDTLPLYGSFINGGFFNFPGYQRGELTNQGNVIGRLIVFHTLYGKTTGLLTSPVYGGFTFDNGQFWRTDAKDEFLTAGSLFVGADTPILPVYLGVGLAEGGVIAGYITIDRPF